MAYFSQEMKKVRVAVLKNIMKKYGMKATYSVRNHSTFEVNIKSGKLDIIGNYKKNNRDCRPDLDHIDVNRYYIDSSYDGEVRNFLNEVKAAALGADYFDESDIMTDYFHCSHYIHINVGDWDKPYILTA